MLLIGEAALGVADEHPADAHRRQVAVVPAAVCEATSIVRGRVQYQVGIVSDVQAVGVPYG